MDQTILDADMPRSTPVRLRELVVTAGEPPGSYRVPNASTATRTDAPILETPFSIVVVPRSVIEDQAASRLRDLYPFVRGVQPARTAGNVGALEVPNIRGFDVFSVHRDGFRVGSGIAPVALSNVERIEVLKGPSSVLYGLGEPGGILNIVTKRPLRIPHYSLEQEFGSYGRFETTFDIGGPIATRTVAAPETLPAKGAGAKGVEAPATSEEPALLYRVVGSYLNTESFRDHHEGERYFIAPTVTWLAGPATQVDFDFSYSFDRSTWDDGVFLE